MKFTLEEILNPHAFTEKHAGGSDARIIMGDAEGALRHPWKEERNKLEPADMSVGDRLGNSAERIGVGWGKTDSGTVVRRTNEFDAG